ncbi:MAG: aldo/keto reductase [Verrucomicrobia bacterium]|nr:aldo/keto reductase [Verrucomicrobiota bacterium]
MVTQHDGGLNRRGFLRRLVSLAALIVAGRYDEPLRADEPGSDPLGPVLPRRLLGRTEERVTMLGLGGFHLGMLDDRGAQKMIETALEEGIRFFDSAPQYQEGGSEVKYGRFLTPKYRERVFLMTKTLARDAAGARRDLEGSLRRLATDHKECFAGARREEAGCPSHEDPCRPGFLRPEPLGSPVHGGICLNP